MPGTIDWADEIRKSIDKVVLENVNLSAHDAEEEKTNEGQTTHTIIVGESSVPVTRHVLMIAIDTTNMETVDEEERTVVKGLAVNELIMGNPGIVVACLIQFMKSEKARPLLIKAMLEGVDLGGFEKTVMPRNVGALFDMLMSNRPDQS